MDGYLLTTFTYFNEWMCIICWGDIDQTGPADCSTFVWGTKSIIATCHCTPVPAWPWLLVVSLCPCEARARSRKKGMASYRWPLRDARELRACLGDGHSLLRPKSKATLVARFCAGKARGCCSFWLNQVAAYTSFCFVARRVLGVNHGGEPNTPCSIIDSQGSEIRIPPNSTNEGSGCQFLGSNSELSFSLVIVMHAHVSEDIEVVHT
ncbi:hypothetical protein SETIT_2G181400v2 [Setaria italica]|uniref:Uncharacterized protein n=1 Tax=Setaria italica TaxID=4555 RepID=K3ZWY8_SETIT|nr:hypothetical protein SETIT_2G181400v2 [Setaria italica]